MNAAFLLTAILQGLAFAGLGYGIYVSLRIFNIPDITTDGSYALGGVVTAICISSGMHPLYAMSIAAVAGALAGMCSGLIHTKLKVNALLAGILVMTALYSINLILLGRPNLPLIDTPSFFSLIPFGSALSKSIFALLAFLLFITIILRYLLKSDFGIAMRATGNNEAMVRAMGVNVSSMKVIGLSIANALTALSGSLITQYQGFADINMGIGIVISGLGAVMMGEAVFGKIIKRNIYIHLIAVATGCILFRLAIAGALSAGVDPNYLRLITSLIVLVIIALASAKKETGDMIQLQHISKTFHSGEAMEVKAIQDLQLKIESEDFIVVVGANGSGKSTLLNLLAGTFAPDVGNILFDGVSVNQLQEHQRSKYIARLFQNPLMGTAPDLSILENFRLAALRTSSKKLHIGINATFRQGVADSIQRVGMGLENKLDTPMGQLSGGQRQALTLLMSTMDNCKILLMDEPTSALDPRSSELIMDLAKNIIQEKKICALLVTHRLKDCIQFGNRILFMKEGKVEQDISGVSKNEISLEKLYAWFE